MAELIVSKSNPEIKKIHLLKDKKNRDESGLFYVEGIRPVIEAYSQKAEIDRIVYCPALLRSQVALDLINEIAVCSPDLLLKVDEKVFKHLAQKEGPQGLAAVVHQKWESLGILDDSTDGIWVGLDSVQDPGNLGTILRTLNSVGGKGIILLGEGTDVYHPTAIRASMGAIFALRIIRSGQREFVDWKRKVDFPCYGAVCESAMDYQAIHYPKRITLLMGSEQKGLSPSLAGACDQLIHIPMKGNVDSLNLSIAASIILYEVYNQIRKRG